MIECPNHKGGFDCNPFCSICEGNQEFELSEDQDGLWEITFCYDGFVISAAAYGRTEQEAIEVAQSKIPSIDEQVLEIEANLEGII
jgi:hypothetical protein|tara:strand:- start:1709 stop:1966 length:258 start_codon:yes stop_codon:yes gene_type:complete